MKNNIFLSAMLITMIFSVMSCKDDDKGQIQSLGIQEAVYVSGSRVMRLTLKDNATLQVTPVFTPADAANKTLEYSNLYPSIMEVNSTGLITGKAPGTDTLIVRTTDGSKIEARYQVVVTDHIVKATGITVSAAGRNMEIEIGQTFDLKAEVTVNPADVTDNSVTFLSLNPEVATVDENGIVTTVALGSTVIVITTADGSDISTECNVTVVAEAPFYIEKAPGLWQLSCNLALKEGALENLLDDNNSTFWAPDILKRPNYSPACWLDIDFGEVIKFAQLRYRHRGFNYSHVQCRKFTLQGKTSESDAWTDLGEYL